MSRPPDLPELERRAGEGAGRLRLLLARRRAGQIDDEGLFLAASLGEPAARALWQPQLPDEEALLIGELAPFFEGIAAARRRSWEKARGEASFMQMRCLDAAWELPRLRRLFPKVVGAQLRWSHCDRYPFSSGPVIAVDGGRLRLRRPLQRERDFVLETEDPFAAIEAARASLPRDPMPVWRGDQRSLPVARARLGLFNDVLGEEGVMAGVFRWPIGVGRRAALALRSEVQAVWDAVRPEDGRLAASFEASRRWVLAPDDEEGERAAREAGHQARLAAVAARRDGHLDAAAAGHFAATIPEHLRSLSGLSAAFSLIGMDRAFVIIREALIPWALRMEPPGP